MSLCVLGRESLDELSHMIVPLFQQTVNKNITVPRWDDPPYTSSQLQVCLPDVSLYVALFVFMSLCLSVSLAVSVCLPFFLSVFLFVFLSFSLSVFMSIYVTMEKLQPIVTATLGVGYHEHPMGVLICTTH